jgi:hypothetical protein
MLFVYLDARKGSALLAWLCVLVYVRGSFRRLTPLSVGSKFKVVCQQRVSPSDAGPPALPPRHSQHTVHALADTPPEYSTHRVSRTL